MAESNALVADLIQNVTGFSEQEENFVLCERFVVSNLRYHNYLDTNSHEVKKKLDGTIEKMLTHACFSRAFKLREVTDRLLKHHSFKKIHQSELQWKFVDILLRLSQHPSRPTPRLLASSAPLFPTVSSFVQKEEVFDWKTYLKEPSPPTPPPDDSELWHLTDEESDDHEVPQETEVLSSKENVHKEQVCLIAEDSTNETKEQVSSFLEYVANQDWLKEDGKKTYPDWFPPEWRLIQEELSQDAVQRREYELMYELLTFLQFPTGGRILDVCDGRVILKNQVSLCSITQGTVESIIASIAPVALFVLTIQSFVKDNIDGRHGFIMQAYAESLQDMFCSYVKAVSKSQDKLVLQEEAFTLSMMLRELRPWFDKLSYLRSVHTHVEEHPMENPPNWFLASHLLTVLRDASMNPIGNSLYQNCLQPYLALLESLVSRGEFRDPHNELALVWDEHLQISSGTWWSDVIKIRAVESLSTELQPLFITVQRAARAWILFNMLSVDTKADVLNKMGGDDQNFLCFPKVDEEAESVVEGEGAAPVIDQDYKALQSKIANHLVTLFKSMVTKEKQPRRKVKPSKNVVLELIALQQRSSKISDILEKEVMKKLELLQHLRMFRAVYLMEAGDLMQRFHTTLFHELTENPLEVDWHHLTECLQENLTEKFPGFAHTISLTPPKRATTFLDNLSELKVIHETSDCLLLFFSEDSFFKYQTIYNFLLQLKGALHVLNRLRFKDLRMEHAGVEKVGDLLITPLMKERRLQLLRMWLLHFLVSIHCYAMTRVVHSTSVQMETVLSATKDLTTFGKSHEDMVNSIWHACLLDRRFSMVTSCIFRVCKLAMLLERTWCCDTVDYDYLVYLENQYRKEHRFLANTLHPLQRQRTLPHLEGLALSIISSCPGEA